MYYAYESRLLGLARLANFAEVTLILAKHQTHHVYREIRSSAHAQYVTSCSTSFPGVHFVMRKEILISVADQKDHGLWERDCQLFCCWPGSLGWLN